MNFKAKRTVKYLDLFGDKLTYSEIQSMEIPLLDKMAEIYSEKNIASLTKPPITGI